MDGSNPKDKVWRIGLISSETGEFLGKISFPTFVTERQMRWHLSGKFIAQIFYAGENANLMFLPIGGGESKTFSGLGKGDVSSFAFSRDGQQIALTRNAETREAVLIQTIASNSINNRKH